MGMRGNRRRPLSQPDAETLAPPATSASDLTLRDLLSGAARPPTEEADPAARNGAPGPERASVTGRMATLLRDPGYARTQKLLATRRRGRGGLTACVIAVDAALTLVALVILALNQDALAEWLAGWLPVGAPPRAVIGAFSVDTISVDTIATCAVILVVWPAVFSALHVYRGTWTRGPFSLTPAPRAAVVACLVSSGLLYIMGLGAGRFLLLTFAVADAAVLVVARGLLRPLRGLRRRRVLVVGTGRLGLDAARAVYAHRGSGLELAGVLGPDVEVLAHRSSDAEVYRTWGPLRLGDLDQLHAVVRDKEIDLVVVGLGAAERERTGWVISGVAHLPVQLYVVPDVVADTAKVATEVVDGLPVLGLTESAIYGWAAAIKRTIDLAICVPAALALAPAMLLITLAIRLDSRGPALFNQERVGQHNRRFVIHKFRTMYVDRPAQGATAGGAPDGRRADQTGNPVAHKLRGDPRVTRVGRFLRQTSLDELPQLWNVIKGDMSLVGPRPELPWIVEDYRAWQYRRLLVPQGLTGWWQVHGRGERMMHLHTQDDIYYVRNASLWLDLKILLLTVKVVLTGRGAF